MGGDDSVDNLVKLTPEEHVIAHLLLVKIYPDNPKLVYAANIMTSRVKNNGEYGWLKREFSRVDSLAKKGIPRSADSVEKQRATIINKYKNGYVSPHAGRTLSDSHKLAISEGNKGKQIPVIARSSLEGFVLRYGEELGVELFKLTNLKKRC